MKKYRIQQGLAVCLALISSSSFAINSPEPATVFNCVGKGIAASYQDSAASFIGISSLSFTIGSITVSGTNNEYTVQKTVAGNLMTLVTKTVPNESTDSLSLLLPDVNLSGKVVVFNTQLIKTHTLTTPPTGFLYVNGVVQKNVIVPVKCQAHRVIG
jgi:hypothetical protein